MVGGEVDSLPPPVLAWGLGGWVLVTSAAGARTAEAVEMRPVSPSSSLTGTDAVSSAGLEVGEKASCPG